MMLSLFSRVLKRIGCDVVTVKGPAAAADALANNTVDVVISDLRMPAISDGERFLSQIHRRYPDLAVWMMSSELCKDKREKLLQAGAANCIEKPLDPTNIGLLIDQLDVPNLRREPALFLST